MSFLPDSRNIHFKDPLVEVAPANTDSEVRELLAEVYNHNCNIYQRMMPEFYFVPLRRFVAGLAQTSSLERLWIWNTPKFIEKGFLEILWTFCNTRLEGSYLEQYLERRKVPIEIVGSFKHTDLRKYTEAELEARKVLENYTNYPNRPTHLMLRYLLGVSKKVSVEEIQTKYLAPRTIPKNITQAKFIAAFEMWLTMYQDERPHLARLYKHLVEFLDTEGDEQIRFVQALEEKNFLESLEYILCRSKQTPEDMLKYLNKSLSNN